MPDGVWGVFAQIRNKMPTQRRQPILILVLLLAGGFLLTSLVSYFVSRASLRARISERELPLTSDNIYSELQRDLLRPILISSLMASDTFLRDWVVNGEQDVDVIARYLESMRVEHDTFSSFFISERTKNYYHAGGILKQVSEDEERDAWYFRVREMEPVYEINVDRDMANLDAMTIFINHKVFDREGGFLGATGVGLTVDAVKRRIDHYRDKYGRSIFLTDTEGKLTLSSSRYHEDVANIHDMEGLSGIADLILGSEDGQFTYRLDDGTVHLNTRFIPELNWYLLVEQRETAATSNIFQALLINLAFCVLITAVVILLANMTIKAHQKKMARLEEEDRILRGVTEDQQEEIARQNTELRKQNERLEKALTEVKTLSGMLPICASCKKIRDDKGYWSRIEEYITLHSEAQFTHGICPKCAERLYPGLTD